MLLVPKLAFLPQLRPLELEQGCLDLYVLGDVDLDA